MLTRQKRQYHKTQVTLDNDSVSLLIQHDRHSANEGTIRGEQDRHSTHPWSIIKATKNKKANKNEVESAMEEIGC